MDSGYGVYEYSRRGMLAELKEELATGVGPDDYLGYDGSTPLVMAARCGHGHIVRELLAQGADSSVRTEEGSTVLHHAVSGGSAEAASALLEAGLGANTANEDGVVPLILAAHYKRADIVRILCEAGADINWHADGWGTPLDAADGEIAEYLEKRGAKRSAGGADQPTAVASERFHYGCFENGNMPTPAATATTGPSRAPAAKSSKRPAVGDHVKLRGGKVGLLKEGDVGVVLADFGDESVPLKVGLGEAHDYYDVDDVEICDPPVELPPDSDRATAEGTKRFLSQKLEHASNIVQFGSTGLHVSPVGFGCHRLEDDKEQRMAMELALTVGCNFVDLAPNYTDGVAERVAGEVLKELMGSKKVRRDELVIATKVGNVLGQQLQHAEGVPNMAKINDNLMHCISPEWIEQELTRSLERLQLECVDCLLLHCPEYESKAADVDMAMVYSRLGEAFLHLEKEVEKGRVAVYGVSAAFQPLRPTDPEHLDLAEVLAQLPEGHHFRVIQFPLNFAEPDTLWVGHTQRNADGTAVTKELALTAPTLFELAKEHGIATLVNRPLDGIYKESHGVLRFSSLDCDVRSFSELQLDNCDVLEEKLTSMCKLGGPPHNAGDGASGQLAAKTVKVLSSLGDVDCVLLGMRRPEYVVGTLPLAFRSPPVDPETARSAVRSVHNTIQMWFATAIHEADHGTAKDWRLPAPPTVADPQGVGA